MPEVDVPCSLLTDSQEDRGGLAFPLNLKVWKRVLLISYFEENYQKCLPYHAISYSGVVFLYFPKTFSSPWWLLVMLSDWT